MTLNAYQKKIQAAVARAANGKINLPDEDGMCLSAVRRVLENALGWASHDLYRLLVTHRIESGPPGRAPYAADMELSMRERGYTVPLGSEIQPGDILFSAFPQPFGHVALAYLNKQDGKLWVLENAQVRRRGAVTIDGPNQLVPLENWGEKITTIGRLPADYPAEPEPAKPESIKSYPEVPALPPQPAPGPVVTPVLGRDERRVLLDTGNGTYQDITGQRVEVSKTSGVVINAKGDTIWIRAK